jgi:hypothetical protein
MRTHPLPAPGRSTRLSIGAMLCVAGALSGCLRNPSADAITAQALTEIADQLGAMQQDNAALQEQLDSLRTAVARQDTVVRRLANLAGLPVAP